MEQHKKPIRFSPSQRKAMMLKIQKLAENNPEYKRFTDTATYDALVDLEYTWEENQEDCKSVFETYIKDTFEDELADAVIRAMDLAGGLGIDLGKHIDMKLEYNKTRERLHGKLY